MITYVYKCKECGNTFEIQQRITEQKITECPQCEGHQNLERVLQPAAGFRIYGRGVNKPTSRLT